MLDIYIKKEKYQFSWLVLLLMLGLLLCGCSQAPENSDTGSVGEDAAAFVENDSETSMDEADLKFMEEMDRFEELSEIYFPDYIKVTYGGPRLPEWGVLTEYGLICTELNESGVEYENHPMGGASPPTTIGFIENPGIASGDMVQIGTKLFFYGSKVPEAEESAPDLEEDPNALNHTHVILYQIDLEQMNLTSLTEDDVYQTLVYVDGTEDKLLTLKGKLIDDGKKEITYISAITPESGNYEEEILLTLEVDCETVTGDSARNFCVTGDTIYVLVYREAQGLARYLIRTFALDGTPGEEIELDETLQAFLTEEFPSEIEVFGSAGVLTTFSLNGVLFDLSSGMAVSKLLSHDNLHCAYPLAAGDYSQALLYTEEGQIWRIEAETGVLSLLDTPWDGCQGIVVGSRGRMVMWQFIEELFDRPKMLYGLYSQIPVREEWTISEMEYQEIA